MRANYPALSPGADSQMPAAYAAPVLSLEQVAQPGMSIAQIWALVKANWKISLAIFGALLLLSAIVIRLLPKTYTATAAVILNYEVYDPVAGREYPLGLLASHVATQVEIIQGPQVLGTVIDKLDLTKNDDFTSGYGGDGSDLREWVMESLRNRLEVRPSWNGGQIIYIKASTRGPAEAAAIANAVADTYLNQQVRRLNAPASEQANLYASQMDELRARVTRAQERITKFRRDTGVVEIDSIGSIDIDMQSLANLEQRYIEAQNLRRAAEVQQVGNRAAASEKSAELRGELAQLQTTLGPQHPQVQELRSRIGALEGSMVQKANVDLAAARDLEEKLAKAVDEQRGKLIGVRGNQAEGAKLLLELQSAMAVYKRALDGFDQISAAANSQYSNVSLLTRAEVPVKAAKPRKLKYLAFAALLSLGIGLLGPILYELLFRRRVRCADDVERDLGLPVLAEFDDLNAVARAGAAA